MANNCKVPTPRSYVTQMLNYIKYRNNVFGKCVLENSCGQGNILLEVVKRYIVDARQNNISDEQIAKGIERDIVAFEVDEKEITICIERLNNLADNMGMPPINWNINNKDFLKQPNGKYDYIIGNPPYKVSFSIYTSLKTFILQHFRKYYLSRCTI